MKQRGACPAQWGGRSQRGEVTWHTGDIIWHSGELTWNSGDIIWNSGELIWVSGDISWNTGELSVNCRIAVSNMRNQTNVVLWGQLLFFELFFSGACRYKIQVMLQEVFCCEQNIWRWDERIKKRLTLKIQSRSNAHVSMRLKEELYPILTCSAVRRLSRWSIMIHSTPCLKSATLVFPK